MATDLRDQLQTTLSGTHTIERELGGGGMSRVFVAEEQRLKRKVVVKVLSPELAQGISADRFEREIQVAASLQQANIVPVLTTGDTNGLPFYTMPFVEGQSLRSRLARGDALSITEIVGVLRDVARALSYAHERGVIHRDIKPDNVLLSGGTAVVTDFGIAKALSASRKPGEHETLTQLGTSIGTPAYMSPEQAAGDPDIDHRADIYAFGCMAYELLAGRPPFHGRTPQRVLAAHMGEAPQPVGELRLDTPHALADLVMQCLAKEPAARPQNAAELVRVLDTVTSSGTLPAMPAILLSGRGMLKKAVALYVVAFAVVAIVAKAAIIVVGLPDWVFPAALIVMALGLPAILFTAYVQRVTRQALTATPTYTPGGSPSMGGGTMATLAVKASPMVSWRRTAAGGVWAMGIFVVGVGGYMLLRAFGIGPAGSLLAKGVIKTSDEVLVTDFESPTGDSTLGGVVSEGVRDGLSESRSVRVVQPSATTAALQQMQRPPSTRIDLQVAREMAERLGAKAIVDGKVTPVGATGSYILTVQLFAAGGEQLASFRESAKDGTDLIPAIDRVTRDLRGKLGESLKLVHATPPLEQATTASLPALRAYSEGVHANLAHDYPKAIAALEQAITLDSTFGLAYRLASIVYVNARLRPGRADTLRGRAFALRARLPDLERALVEGTYYYSGPHADRALSIAANQRALELDPTSASALNNLALAYVSRRQYARAESVFKREQEAHPENSYGWSNLVFAQVDAGKLREALATAEDYQRRFPTNATAVSMAVNIWAAEGQRDSVSAICRRATQSSSDQVRDDGYRCLAELALTSGRLAEAERLRAQYAQSEAVRGTPAIEALLPEDSAYVDVWFRGRAADGVRELDAFLARRPLREYPPEEQNYFDFASDYASAGRPDKARAVLAQYDADVRDTARLRLDASGRRGALGEIELAEKKYDLAIRDFQASDTSYDGAPIACSACTPASLGRAYDLADKPDQAIAEFEQYLASTYYIRAFTVDPYFLAGTYKRLGELYEAKADRETAPAAAKADRDKAALYDAKFIDLWKDADPELQPQVTEVKQRLAQLGKKGG